MVKTGRKYTCKGKRQHLALFWNLHIEIGDTLSEVTIENYQAPNGTLLLQVNNKTCLLVDANQFKEQNYNLNQFVNTDKKY